MNYKHVPPYGSVYIPSFPFSNLRTKNEFPFRFQILRAKNEKRIPFSFSNLRPKNKKRIRFSFSKVKFPPLFSAGLGISFMLMIVLWLYTVNYTCKTLPTGLQKLQEPSAWSSAFGRRNRYFNLHPVSSPRIAHCSLGTKSNSLNSINYIGRCLTSICSVDRELGIN